ncbi:hypothetical protein [Pelistega europaea]|uniref:Uncharacterized protein n=1 Tax=Pelistega europaea TaxID=106147 RepID=A0A7Y4LB00_9BURK|nr:hypothetical protein [Pelistega europaea]NOL49206.1 hypothetical protein [Pelistega europaea]
MNEVEKFLEALKFLIDNKAKNLSPMFAMYPTDILKNRENTSGRNDEDFTAIFLLEDWAIALEDITGIEDLDNTVSDIMIQLAEAEDHMTEEQRLAFIAPIEKLYNKAQYTLNAMR